MTLFTQVNTLVTRTLLSLIEKIEEGCCTPRDIKRLQLRLETLGNITSPLQLLLLESAAIIRRKQDSLQVVTLEAMRTRLSNAVQTIKPKRRRPERVPKSQLRMGASDLQLDRMPVVCPDGARVVLSWDPDRKGIVVLADSPISIVPQGPRSVLLLVR